jgi:hypothetical protein
MSAELPAPQSRSWLRTLADAARLRALPFAGLAFGVMIVAFGLWELAFDRLATARLPGDPDTVIPDARVAVTHIACVAYLMAAIVHGLRAGDESISRVAPLLEDGPEVRSALDPSSERGILIVAGLAGAGVWLAATVMSPGTVRIDPRAWTAEVAWHRILGLTLGVLAVRLSVLLVLQSLRLSRLAAHIRELDLLDLSSLSVFTRRGLNNALLILGFAATFSLFLLNPGYRVLAGSAWLLVAGVAALGLLLPLFGAHERIQEAKQTELSWARAQLREARNVLAAGSRSPSRLDELVVWERRIEEIREWPLDTHALSRFGLYLMIPLGSWSAGALVERLIDQILG